MVGKDKIIILRMAEKDKGKIAEAAKKQGNSITYFVTQTALKEAKKILSKKDLQQGLRLACLTQIKSDVKILIPDSSIITKQKLQIKSDYPTEIKIDPIIQTTTFKIPPPTLV